MGSWLDSLDHELMVGFIKAQDITECKVFLLVSKNSDVFFYQLENIAKLFIPTNNINQECFPCLQICMLLFQVILGWSLGRKNLRSIPACEISFIILKNTDIEDKLKKHSSCCKRITTYETYKSHNIQHCIDHTTWACLCSCTLEWVNLIL